MLEVGETPLVGGIAMGLGAGEEEVLFLLRPNGWKDLNREFMRSMYGKRRGGWEAGREEEEVNRAMRGRREGE